MISKTPSFSIIPSNSLTFIVGFLLAGATTSATFPSSTSRILSLLGSSFSGSEYVTDAILASSSSSKALLLGLNERDLFSSSLAALPASLAGLLSVLDSSLAVRDLVSFFGSSLSFTCSLTGSGRGDGSSLAGFGSRESFEVAASTVPFVISVTFCLLNLGFSGEGEAGC